MHKFPETEYKRFSDLPLDQFNALKFSIYILDFKWNYLFVNDFVYKNLGLDEKNLKGKNMWREFKALSEDPFFRLLKKNMENKIVTNHITTSPLNGQRLNVIGYPLEDCFYFSSSILPDKEDLINELRDQLRKKK